MNDPTQGRIVKRQREHTSRKKQSLTSLMAGEPREKHRDNCYQNLYNGNSGGLGNPTAGNESSYQYHQRQTENLNMNIPMQPMEKIQFRGNDAYSLKSSFNDQVYQRNYDLDKKPLYFESQNRRTKFDSEDDYVDALGRIRNNFEGLPKSFGSTVLTRQFDLLAERRAEERRETLSERVKRETQNQYSIKTDYGKYW